MQYGTITLNRDNVQQCDMLLDRTDVNRMHIPRRWVMKGIGFLNLRTYCYGYSFSFSTAEECIVKASLGYIRFKQIRKLKFVMRANIYFQVGYLSVGYLYEHEIRKRKSVGADEARRDLTTDTCVILFTVLVFII